MKIIQCVLASLLALPIVYIAVTMAFHAKTPSLSHPWFEFWIVPTQQHRYDWIATFLFSYAITVVGIAFTVFEILPYFQRRNIAHRMVSTKENWVQACEKQINDFLKSKYVVSIRPVIKSIPDNPLNIEILVNNCVMTSANWPIRHSLSDEQYASCLADDMINDYNTRKPNSILFKAISAYDDFATAEKHFKKQSVRKIDVSKQ